MRNIIIFCCLLMLLSCKGAYKSTSGGKEDVGFLSLVGDPEKYKAGVMVSVDNGQPAIVEVEQEGKLSKDDKRLKVPAGKHAVKITYQNRTVYSQNMIFFAQETKKITLP